MGRQGSRESSEVNDSPSLQVRKMAITQQSTMKGVRVRGGDKARRIRLSGNIGSSGHRRHHVFFAVMKRSRR